MRDSDDKTIRNFFQKNDRWGWTVGAIIALIGFILVVAVVCKVRKEEKKHLETKRILIAKQSKENRFPAYKK